MSSPEPSPDLQGAPPAELTAAERAVLTQLGSAAAGQAGSENFPVAARVLPAQVRGTLLRIYAYARFVDDVGDEADGDRLRLLDLVEADVHAAAQGTAQLPAVRALQPDLASGRIPLGPLLDLVAANRLDQTVTDYRTFGDLVDRYCRLSADPVGRLVLAVAGADTPANRTASDRICSGLQVLEHCQDVGADARNGRVYLPGDDLVAAGLERDALLARRTGPALREVIAQQVDRAEVLLRAGGRLPARLSGWARLAVAGYLAGGLATVDALRAADFDVLARQVTPSKAAVARHLAAVLASATTAGLRPRRRVEDTDDLVRAAYRHSERVTRREARNFAWGISLLPGDKRRALSAVYAFARRIDDIGDGELPADEKVRRLAEARAVVHAPDKHPDDVVLVALADAARRLPIPLDAFDDLVSGCEMDVAGRQYRTLEDLVEYCRCVAGSIGRLCLGVFAPPLPPLRHAEAVRLADDLGVALQLTNILRDVREDLTLGRIYLPREDLDRFACEVRLRADGSLDPYDGRLAALIRHEATVARRYYARGLDLLDLLDGRSAACCAALAGIYQQLLAEIEAAPDRTFTDRLRISGGAKARIAVRALAVRRG